MQTEGKKAPSYLGYVMTRWQQELEPVLKDATLQQEQELEVLWERTLQWLKGERGLERDSLRKPITQIRALIKALPLTESNTWRDSRSGRKEHIALHVFNLPEQEWERMNARTQLTVQERLENQQLLERPDAIVNQALVLIQSDDWAELVVALALCTGRRLAELMKTCTFTEKTAYSVWFTGQVKGRGREDEAFEVPTLVRAFLIVEALQRLRRLIDCTDLDVEQVSQKYNQAVNKVVNHYFEDLIPVRATRDRLHVHLLRAVFARIATFWYAPPNVADITYMAQVQGHRYILDPEVEKGETDEDIKNKRLNYASNANYFDYKIGIDGNIDGRQGIRLGRPGVTVIDAFVHAVPVEEQEEEGQRTQKRKGKAKRPESTSDWVPLTVRRRSRDWFREQISETRASSLPQSQKDDALLRKLLTQFVIGGNQATPSEAPVLSLDLLEISDKQRDVLRQAMALAGSVDLLSFLLAAGEQVALQLTAQVSHHGARHYESLPTEKLDTRDPDAYSERFRRAIYCVMKYNQEHSLADRWYLTDLAIQNLVGGRKESIKAYKAARAEEIASHHRELDIRPSFNRKPGKVRIQDVIVIPNEATAYPWGQPASAASPV